MRYDKLDLALAVAAVVRGERCSRRSNENEYLYFDGVNVMLGRNKGKDVQLKYADLFHDWDTKDWDIISCNKAWLEG